jgi:hypothetical protein
MEFIPASETAKQEVLSYAKTQIRVYGVDVNEAPDDALESGNPERFIEEAEAQGLVWSLAGFQLQFNSGELNQDNILIKII